MSNSLKKDRELIVVGDGWEDTTQFCWSGISDVLLATWEATYQTAVGNQASDILLLKKLFVLILKNKFNQSNEKVDVLLWPWWSHGFCDNE